MLPFLMSFLIRLNRIASRVLIRMEMIAMGRKSSMVLGLPGSLGFLQMNIMRAVAWAAGISRFLNHELRSEARLEAMVRVSCSLLGGG
jgi:hypothetical protein